MQSLDRFKKIKENVSLYFDNALSKEDEETLMKNVDSDPDCCQIFNKERSAREFLKNNVRRSSVSSDLMDTIKKNLHF